MNVMFHDRDGSACRVEIPDEKPRFVRMGPKIYEHSGLSPLLPALPAYHEIEVASIPFSAVRENVR